MGKFLQGAIVGVKVKVRWPSGESVPVPSCRSQRASKYVPYIPSFFPLGSVL